MADMMRVNVGLDKASPTFERSIRLLKVKKDQMGRGTRYDCTSRKTARHFSIAIACVNSLSNIARAFAPI